MQSTYFSRWQFYSVFSCVILQFAYSPTPYPLGLPVASFVSTYIYRCIYMYIYIYVNENVQSVEAEPMFMHNAFVCLSIRGIKGYSWAS